MFRIFLCANRSFVKWITLFCCVTRNLGDRRRVNETSEIPKLSAFAAFLRESVFRRLDTLEKDASHGVAAGEIIFSDGRYGMGNQLMGLGSTILVGALTGRRVKIELSGGEGIDWLWKEFFYPPSSDWFANVTASRQAPHISIVEACRNPYNYTTNRTFQSIRLKASYLTSRFFVSGPLQWNATLWSLGGDSAVIAFPYKRYANPILDVVLAHSLGALSWTPRPKFQLEIETWQNNILLSNTIGYQMRACLDCNHRQMPSSMILQDVICDLHWLFNSDNTIKRSPHSIYITTESQKAATLINTTMVQIDRLAHRYFSASKPEMIKFVHTANSRRSANIFVSQLGPVLDWYLLGEFDHVFTCGTSYGATAVARRSNSLPLSYVHHMHPIQKYPTSVSDYDANNCTCGPPSPYDCPELILSERGAHEYIFQNFMDHE